MSSSRPSGCEYPHTNSSLPPTNPSISPVDPTELAISSGVGWMRNGSSSEVVVHPLPPQQGRQQYPPDEFRPRKRWFPWLVPTIVVANVVMFVVTMYVNNCPKNYLSCVATFLGRFSFQPFKENPLLGPSSLTLLKMGALEVTKVVQQHQKWRLISCIWLHAGVFHILSNMLSLLFVGIRLEREFGFVRIGLVYLVSGIGGSLLSALFILSSISVGASGAVFGLLGGMLSELITNWTIYANKFAMFVSLVFIIAVNLAVGILPNVDNFAHIGGFVSGFLLGFVLLIRPQYGWVSHKSFPLAHHSRSNVRKHKMYQYILWIISAILLIIGFTVGFVLLFRGFIANDHCSWCHYLNCIPTSKWNCNQTSAYCEISSYGVQTNLTCQGSGKNRSYQLTDPTSGQLNSLCAQLCL